MPTTTPSARNVVLLNAWANTIVFFLLLLFPRRFYASHTTRFVTKWTGLPLVELHELNSPAHALILAFEVVVLIHLWMAAATDRKHAHTSLALMELLYITVVLIACSPITPHEFGSSIGLVGVVPNLAFAVAIMITGDIRGGDFISLFRGDDGIRKVDGKRADD